MRHALSLARRNVGQTWPNPAVGAVVVKDGAIIGTGWTARGGRPHAEPQALAQAGAAARGATMYITLEPCAHHGKTPPCTDAIIASGIARCVIACIDPHQEVDGKGVAALKKAGIAITDDIAQQEAHAVNAGFFSVVERGRPWVTVKIATSLDGFMSSTQQRWITGERARAFGHYLRSTHDAILTGTGTVMTDDPLLTCRLPGLEDRSPVRVVMGQTPLPGTSKLKASENDVALWHEEEHDPAQVLKNLAQRGITRVLLEAGPKLTAAFLNAVLADELYWFRSPQALGENGAHPFEPATMNTHLIRRDTRALGEDMLEVYTCSPA